MFRLVKILNSGVNVAEPCYIYAAYSVDYKIGTLVCYKDGALYNAASTDSPDYVVGENIAHGTKRRITVYPINGDMIFETHFVEEPMYINIGDKVTLAIDKDGCAVGVTSDKTNGVAEIYNMDTAYYSNDKVLVRFTNN